jgi:hypothetical protein
LLHWYLFPLSAGAIGDACTTQTDCIHGFCSSSVCASCTADTDCGSGNFCSTLATATFGSSSTCSTGSNNDVCGAGDDCDSTYCGTDYCTTGSVGNACNAVGDCTSGFCVGSTCSSGADGQACVAGTDCTSGFCVGSTCSSGADGQACVAGTDCTSGFCAGSVCTDGAIGTTCDTGENGDCSSGYCDPTGDTCAVAPVASGGGDPHYTLHFNEFITVQTLCDLVLMDSPAAADGLGITLQARHATPKSSREAVSGESYSYISNIVLRIGNVVFELRAEGAKLFRDGAEHNVEDNGGVASAGLPYVIKRHVKGQRKNQIQYEFIFGDNSKIALRANVHYKMAYVEVSGFKDVDVRGFLGKTNHHGFFDRDDTLMGDSADKVNLEAYAQVWQVQENETKLFMEKDVFPQAPHVCVFVDSGNGFDINNPFEKKLRGSPRRKLAQVDSKLEKMANAACAHLSDSNPKKSWCIDDVISTGVVEVAEDPFYA